MGQNASKQIKKTAENVIRKVTETKPPPTSSSSATAAAATGSSNTTGKSSEPANPAMFLRGGGIATHDVRDVGQEMFWKNMHKIDVEKDTSRNNASTGPPEMPPELLKFIQDVGPVRQTLDKDLTTPRLLEKENVQELNKVESVRKPIRERRKMPLMGEDDNFTTIRNTNFTSSRPEEDKDIGTTNLQLYKLLWKKNETNVYDVDATVESFLKDMESGASNGWTDEEKIQQQHRLKQALNALEIPVLRKDPEGNIFGLYPADVPGDEVKSVQPIPPNKIKLVLQDITDGSADVGLAGERLQQRRQSRKGTSRTS